ncbi:hypothetical protein FQN60_009838 [Etheostoma spectabile]|uniref:Uncharacterized protein n=1 Tax=Etheostoma spectabile TaxID=54343 RepID=A0A5J5D650_9PERO|nr:hypothetical protein FQN60_009838 [Etheostoma spectabile]
MNRINMSPPPSSSPIAPVDGGSNTLTHCSVTVPLRKCTCSHFLLFVWGGLALGRYGVKLEHQSEQKTREKRNLIAVAHRDTVRPPSDLAGRTCEFQTGVLCE